MTDCWNLFMTNIAIFSLFYHFTVLNVASNVLLRLVGTLDGVKRNETGEIAYLYCLCTFLFGFYMNVRWLSKQRYDTMINMVFDFHSFRLLPHKSKLTNRQLAENERKREKAAVAVVVVAATEATNHSQKRHRKPVRWFIWGKNEAKYNTILNSNVYFTFHFSPLLIVVHPMRMFKRHRMFCKLKIRLKQQQQQPKNRFRSSFLHCILAIIVPVVVVIST